MARDLSLDDIMVFRSFTLRQMWQLLRRAQVCVVPSFREGLGLALLEAMALGCPVVASETAGIEEVIEHGVSGLLVQVGDEKGFADAIVRVIRSTQLKAKLTRGAQRQVKSEFDADRMARQHLELYNRLAAGRSRR